MHFPAATLVHCSWFRGAQAVSATRVVLVTGIHSGCYSEFYGDCKSAAGCSGVSLHL